MGGRCPHPRDQRSSVPGGDRQHCGACGKDFTPRGVTRHGTYRGYCRHSKNKSGEWCWPPCGPCAAAARQWRTEYEERPEAKVARHRRSAARMAALERMRKSSPGTYMAFYKQEMDRRGGGRAPYRTSVPVWDDIIARLVKEALGMDEHTAAERARSRLATTREREVMRQVARLRVVMEALRDEAKRKGGETWT
jgi:hypothetical protein